MFLIISFSLLSWSILYSWTFLNWSSNIYFFSVQFSIFLFFNSTFYSTLSSNTCTDCLFLLTIRGNPEASLFFNFQDFFFSEYTFFNLLFSQIEYLLSTLWRCKSSEVFFCYPHWLYFSKFFFYLFIRWGEEGILSCIILCLSLWSLVICSF
jgi:hypothetical protein